MTRDDLEALRRIYEGWAAGDFFAEASLYDPQVVYISEAGDPDPGPHFGVEAMTQWARRFLTSWEDWRIEAEEYREVGDSVVVRVHRRAVGRASRVRVEDHAFHVWTFRGGKVIRIEIFEDEAAALEAVGLRE